MTSRFHLQSITVSDFRSIRGQITIPLDAPVVLLHGHNGAGKTSVLSALELALSGSIDSMRRADPDYLQHLVNINAKRAEISLDIRDSLGEASTFTTSSEDQNWTRSKLLNVEDAEFYRERSYLAQATLGRLIEIYARNDDREASPLTRFVSDVLGLNSLDALIDGLRPASDLRNTKRLVAEIADIDIRAKSIESLQSENRSRIEVLERDFKQLASSVTEQSAELERVGSPDVARLASSIDEADAQVVALTTSRRQLDSLMGSLEEAESAPDGSDLAAIELSASKAALAADEWRTSTGAQLDDLIESSRRYFPDLATVGEVGPSRAVASALKAALRERDRIASALAADDSLAGREKEIADSLATVTARREVIDERIAAEFVQAGDLARILSELVPHLDGAECPVCGRDYSEVSDEPLAAQASRRVAHYSTQAQRVLELSQARAAAENEIRALLEQSRSHKGGRLDAPTRSGMITDASRLSELCDDLAGAMEKAVAGDAALANERRLRAAVADSRRQAKLWSDVAEAAAPVLSGLPFVVNRDDSLRNQLATATESVTQRLRALERVISIRRQLADLDRRQALIFEDLETAKATKAELAGELDGLARRKKSVEHARAVARTIRAKALDTQGSIVRKVFNESLNAIWRDLFVRLAPSEPFVPAFHVTTTARHTIPQLVTQDRRGALGGSPGTMLSSGNLNTAALTLFLALHFSSGDRLPLLVLDDPVQSMDDVHISQFAALLRNSLETTWTAGYRGRS